MGFLDHVSSVLFIASLVLVLDVHHSVDAEQIINDSLQYDRKHLATYPIRSYSSSGGSSRILWPNPIRFKENAMAPVLSFNTKFTVYLQIDEASTREIGYETNNFEGFTFAIMPQRLDASSGSIGGYLGVLNATSDGNPDAHTVFIEFDFVKNIAFSDPDGGYHFGININSMNSTAWAPMSRPGAYRPTQSDCLLGTNDQDPMDIAGGCWITRDSTQELNVWIGYDSSTQMLNVTIADNDANHGCPLGSDQPPDPAPLPSGTSNGTTTISYQVLSHKVDLSAVLNEQMYVGFTYTSHHHMNDLMSVVAWSLLTNSSTGTPLPCPQENPHIPLILRRILSVAMLIIACIAVIGGCAHGCYAYRRRVERRGWRFHIDPEDLAATEVHEFTYKELSQATKKFDEKQALGQGGFGSVYLAFLPGNREFVAVKRVVAKPGHGEREFMAEVMTLGKIRHRNLVRLQGWCHERGELLLVYDLMPNGSLDKLLFSPHNAPAPDSQPQQDDVESLETVEVKFPWERRFKAIVDVAKALVYLHTECEERIIHRDVKAANVMLDAKFNARLGDFGLARSYNHSLLAPASTGVAGTPGYLAPELYYTGVQTEQTDIFSYGAFLLEVACGKRPIYRENHETVLVLVDEVWKMWGDSNILDAADPNLGGVYSVIELNMVLCLGLLCSHPSPAMRPSMKEVLLILNGDASLPHVPRSKPSSGYEIERSFSLGSSYTTDPSLHHTKTINNRHQ